MLGYVNVGQTNKTNWKTLEEGIEKWSKGKTQNKITRTTSHNGQRNNHERHLSLESKTIIDRCNRDSVAKDVSI